MGGTSISYRRDDSTGWADRLSEHLKGRFGQESLLTDDTIEPDTHSAKARHTHDAFISYSRKDEAFASALEKALEAYTPPKDLKVPQRHLDIFRDKEDFTGTGTMLVTASDDHTARLWNTTTGETLVTFTGHTDPVRSITLSADGTQVLTSSDDKTARLWDTATGEQLASFAGHENSVQSAAFSPDGHHVVTASLDKTARLWNAATGELLATLTGHEGSIHAAAFSPDGTQVVTASDDTTARLWNARWITQYHGRGLIDTVCREKLIGARRVTDADAKASPALNGRAGEDVCAPPSWMSLIARTVSFAR